MIPNGHAPDYIVNHPAMKGIDLTQRRTAVARSADGDENAAVQRRRKQSVGQSRRAAAGNMFRAIDKKTGKVIHEMALPAMATGIPMTYMVNDRQYIVVAIGAAGVPASLVALALP